MQMRAEFSCVHYGIYPCFLVALYCFRKDGTETGFPQSNLRQFNAYFSYCFSFSYFQNAYDSLVFSCTVIICIIQLLKYIFSTRDILRSGCVHEIMAKKSNDNINGNTDQYPLCPVVATEKVIAVVCELFPCCYLNFVVISICKQVTANQVIKVESAEVIASSNKVGDEHTATKHN